METELDQSVKDIIIRNIELFGENPHVEKIDVGFTNTAYKINDSYILKICSKNSNEGSFQKEINFYLENRNNPNIPKLFDYSNDKEKGPHFYEIIEKLNGTSLYDVWHTLTEEKREDVIRQLCEILKQFHSTTCEPYDWNNFIKQDALNQLNEAKSKSILSDDEALIIEGATNFFDKYLVSSHFTFVHNDIHFDNIIYNAGVIKIIDFERSMNAPFDYDFSLFFKMVRMPWKFASEEAEKNVDDSDYRCIRDYIRKYYPKLYDIPNVKERLLIYDLCYDLNQYCDFPNNNELKQQILTAARNIITKSVLSYDAISNPYELLDYMSANLEYGWIGNDNKKRVNNLKRFRELYRISNTNEILSTGLSTCIETAVLAKEWFDSKGIPVKLFCHRSYENANNFDKEVKMHLVILFNENDKWYHFEYSNQPERGIHEYNDIVEALQNITSGFAESGDIRELTEVPNVPTGINYKEFNNYVNSLGSFNLPENTNKVL